VPNVAHTKAKPQVSERDDETGKLT